ncbi:MAG: FkbM family methyltransferase [bacterium]
MINRLKLKYRGWRYKHRVDPMEINFILENIKPGQTVVDIGAHKGGYAYWLNKCIIPNGQLFCFEPHPELASYLEKVFFRHLNKSIFIENAGVSSTTGTQNLIVPKQDIKTKIGSTFEEYKKQEEHCKIPVKTETLDNYFKNKNFKINFIKCDVEGHELEVFKGGHNLLIEDKPVLLFECENSYRKGSSIYDVFSYLETLGYKGFFFSKKNIKPINQLRPENISPKGNIHYVNNYLFMNS